MAAQRKYSPRPILGKGEDLATALHQEVQAISNALTSLGQDLRNAERRYKDETDKALAEIVERFKTEITEINGRVVSIAEWSIEMTNEVKGYARIDALVALRSRIEQQGDEILSYAQYIIALNNTVNGKADVHVVLRLENLISTLGDQILAYGGIIQEIQVEVGGKASAFALQTLEGIVTQLGNDLTSMSSAVTSLRNDIISAGVPNRLANSELQEWAPWVLEHAPSTTGYELRAANDSEPTWALKSDVIRTGLILKPSSTYTSTNNYAQLRQGTVLVEPGQYYQASVYLSAHRCSGQIIVTFHDGAGAELPGTLYSNAITTQGSAQVGGKDLDSYFRAYVFGEAPSGAKYAKVLIRSTPLTTAQANSYLFFTCPLFGKALVGQTTPSPYTAGNSGGSASATRELRASVQQIGDDITAMATDVTNLTTAVRNPRPGQNMLVDPVFQITREGAWKQSYLGPWLFGVNNGEEWTLQTDSGENTPFIYASGTYAASATNYGDLIQEGIPVIPGQRYQFSCYLGAHRCEGLIIIQFFGASSTTPITGVGLSNTTLSQPVTVTYPGGPALSGYYRAGGFVTAPAGAAKATFRIRARWTGPTPSSVSNPHLFIARPFMGIADAAQTTFADWAPGAPGNMFAHLRSQGMVWASSTGEGTVGATYELMLRAQDNTGTANAGLGLTAAKINGVWRSQIDITAERFRVLDPASGTITVPFKIVGGVTYIKSAAILDGEITNAKIQNLSASKLTAGALSVGTSITSSNYVAGSQGWGIFAGGGAEFGSVHIRGQLTGPQIGNNIINTNHLASQAAMYVVPFQVIGPGYADANFYAGSGGLDVTRAYICIVQVQVPYTATATPNTWYQFSVKVAIDNNSQAEVIFNRQFSVKSDAVGTIATFSQTFYGFLDPSGYAAFARSGARYVRVTLTAGRSDAYAIGTLICQKN